MIKWRVRGGGREDENRHHCVFVWMNVVLIWYLLAKTMADVTPMKPKNGAEAGHFSIVGSAGVAMVYVK